MKHIIITVLILLYGCGDSSVSYLDQNNQDPQKKENPCDLTPCTELNRTICNDVNLDGIAECHCDEGYQLTGDQCSKIITCIGMKVMAANLTSGTDQSYDPGHGINIFQGLQPDIVMVQEFNYKDNTPTNIRSLVNLAFGTDFNYSRGQENQIPNGIISRWPIIEQGYLNDPAIDNRDLHWGIVDLPGERDLYIFSVHLRSGSKIDQQNAATIISDHINAHKAAHPDQYYYMVGGDFNGVAAVTPDYFGTAFHISKGFPTGMNEKGEESVNTNRSRTAQLDFILFDEALQRLQEPLIFENRTDPEDPLTYENGLVFDSRSFSQNQLDTYFHPVLQSDSNQQLMQHMGIIQALRICY